MVQNFYHNWFEIPAWQNEHEVSKKSNVYATNNKNEFKKNHFARWDTLYVLITCKEKEVIMLKDFEKSIGHCTDVSKKK